jgi:cation:H+ antiporter
VLAAARRFGLPAAFVGATFAAFATSGPELGVSVLAALKGAPQIGMGDALGSNVVNLGLVLGITILVAELRAGPRASDVRLAVLFAAPLLVGLLVPGGGLSRADALILLAMFFAWIALELRSLDRGAAPPRVAGDRRALLAGLGGLLLLFVAGDLIVRAAREAAVLFGIDAYFIGATLVAFGTSVPELAIALAARARGHHELGLATLVGSNLFNGLFIVGAAALIHPIAIGLPEVTITLVAALTLSVLLVPGRDGTLRRWRGAALLAGYAGYVLAMLRAVA